MNAALVPVTRLGEAKSRLAGALRGAERDALVLAMLRDVIGALRAAPEVERVVVVTPDAEVADAARGQGAEALLRDDPGLNPAVDAAGAALASEGAHTLLVVLGDVAGARAEEISALYAALAELGGRGAVLARSDDGGTAALLRAPPDAIASRFGPESARRHAEAAAQAGVPLRALRLASLAVDLDRPEDLEALRRGAAPAPHTRALLARLGPEARP